MLLCCKLFTDGSADVLEDLMCSVASVLSFQLIGSCCEKDCVAIVHEIDVCNDYLYALSKQ